ncbi:MAG: 5-aminolevulinate synthase [Desulfobacter sp.]
MYEQLFTDKLNGLKEKGQYRTFININKLNNQYPRALYTSEAQSESEVIVWCSNDYLGMSQHPEVTLAMKEAIDKYGAGSGGSRNIGGTHREYPALEANLAKLHAKESGLVFPTGYTSNDASIQTLIKLLGNCVVFSDELNHASIIQGIKNAKCEKYIFKHNDYADLESKLKAVSPERPKIVFFESVYSMDGDVAPIKEIVDVARKYNAMTFLDEVHATGIYGPKGAGVASALGISDEITIIQGTLAKAFGVIGGYITGPLDIIDAVRSFASGFIFTTSLPPAIVAACNASLSHLMNSDEEREKLLKNTDILRRIFSDFGISVMDCSTTHILPVKIGCPEKCKSAAHRLLHMHNQYTQPINPPSVPIGTERFRINATPNHTEDQMVHLAECLVEVFEHYEIPLEK